MKHARDASILVIFAVLIAGECAAAAPATAPPTPQRLDAIETKAARAMPAHRLFAAWLDAFNAADPARLRAFNAAHYPAIGPDDFARLRDNSLGLDLRALESATASTLTGLVQERDSDNFLRFTLAVAPGDGERIESLEILYVPRPADFPYPQLTEPEIFEALSGKLSSASAADRFSGAVLVTKHGKTLFGAAYGLADRSRQVPNTLGTRFDIGSMNKMFTATAILQLMEAGRLRLDDTVGKFLPDYPNREVAKKVTIEQLLTHTGGTGDIFGPVFDTHRLELRNNADYIRWYGDRAPEFEPGSRFSYSSYGMVILGRVIEKVSGVSYDDYVARRIFKPAKMTRTWAEPIDALEPGTAIGYMRTPEGGRKPNIDLMPYRGTAAGGGHSTVGDLQRFAAALMSHKLLSPENTRLLITGKVDTTTGNRYAYGFLDRRTNGKGFVGHDGGGPGLNGVLLILPDSGYTIVVLTNIDPPFAGRIGTFVSQRLDARRDAPPTSTP